MSLTDRSADTSHPSPESSPVAAGVAEDALETVPRRLRAPTLRRRIVTRSLLRSLIAVLVGSLLLRLAAQTMGQMLQFYFDEINQNYYALSYTVTGLITASFFIPELLGSPLLGAMSDRYGRRVFIFLGPILGAIAVLITSVTVAIWLLVLTRLLEGLSTASSIPATLGYISEATAGKPRLRARIIGLFEITLVGGIALGAVVGGYLWKFFGTAQTLLGVHLTSPAFALNALIYLASLWVFWWGLKDLRRKQKPGSGQPGMSSELERLRMVVRAPKVWQFVPAWIAIFSIFGIWINHSPRLLTGETGFADQILVGRVSPAEFGNGFAALAILFAGGVLGWSFYIGRHRKTDVMLAATGGLFVLLAAVYGFNHLQDRSGIAWYALLVCFLAGSTILSAFTPAALTYLADVTESYANDRGSIMGLYSVFLGVGQLVGTTTGGKFADWGGIDGLLLLSTLFGLLTIWTLIILRRSETVTA